MNKKLNHRSLLKFGLAALAGIIIGQHTFAMDLLNWQKNPPAFPEAKGAGALSVGGRGGRIIDVTNLNASGPGSFRAACEAEGRRIIIFRVSGIIEIKKAIVIKHPYVTIAGQTAPAGGILLKGHNLVIGTHDVILRFIRIRTGRRYDFKNQEGDCLVLMDDCSNVIVDHCSFSWSNDENVSVWRTGLPIRNITFSWNLIAEGLSYKHASCGFLVGGSEDNAGIENILIHHNLFMNCYNRMPRVGCRDVQIINNVIYNWGWWPTGISCGVQADIINNKYVPGPNTGNRAIEVMVRKDWQGYEYGPLGNPSIYIKGNIGPGNQDPLADNWNMLMENTLWHPLGHPPDAAISRRNKPLETIYPVKIESLSDMESRILAEVGASKRLDENGNWINNRDSVDIRLVKEYGQKKGTIPVDENSVGGFPIIPYSSFSPLSDQDHDGMSTEWELKYHLDPNDSNDMNLDLDGEGYTNIEEFLNGSDPLNN